MTSTIVLFIVGLQGFSRELRTAGGPALRHSISQVIETGLVYYPDANVLIPRCADPPSRTPAFKSVLVSLNAVVPQRAPSRIRSP